MTEYGDEHRIFLQAMMARGIVSAKEMFPLYELSLKRCGSKYHSESIVALKIT